MGFQNSKKLGNFAENFVQELLVKSGLGVTKNEAKGKEDLLKYDLKVYRLNMSRLIEVKFDIMASQTGNIAIEYYNPKIKKDSGIASTKSDFWVYVFQNPLEAWITQVSSLKNYIELECPVKDVFGGDKNSYMKIYNKNQMLEDIFTRIDNLDKYSVMDLLLLGDNGILEG